jgi:hypothetical protein
MQSYQFETTGIQNYLPNELSWERDLLLSQEVLRREYVEIMPPLNKAENISSSNLGSTIEFKFSDPSRWLDTSTLCLIFDVGAITMPASAAQAGQTQECNICMLDGPFAVISRMNVSVGGQSLSTMNELHKHLSAKYLNGAMASHVMQEAQLYNPGCAKFVPILEAPTQFQTAPQIYGKLANSLANFPTSVAHGANAAGAADAMGFVTAQSTSTAAMTVAGYGYQNSIEGSNAQKTVCIKIGDICPFFQQMRYVPLFLLKDIIFSFYFASPVQAFMCDVGTVANAAADTGDPLVGSPPTWVSGQNITSYSVLNCKMTCDLITCSDVLNNRYKMLAASDEGIIMPFDDVAVQSTTFNFTNTGTARQFQVQLSTANLKSLLFYQQSAETAQSQNGWGNTNFHYLGIQNFQLSANNNSLPVNPISRARELMLYNNRSRGVIGNELSEFVPNNPWIAHGMECAPLVPTGTTQALKASAAAGSIPASFVAFFVYTNFEKIINENPDVLKNGMDLKQANSTITIKWNENIYPGAGSPGAGIPVTLLGSATGAYNVHAQMTYQRSLILRNGMIELI